MNLATAHALVTMTTYHKSGSVVSPLRQPGISLVFRHALAARMPNTRRLQHTVATQQSSSSKAGVSRARECERRAFVLGTGLMMGSLSLSVKSASAEDADNKPQTITSPLGLKYQIVKPGTGAQAKTGDYITFDYVLRRSNGYFVYSTTGSGSGQQEPNKFARNYQEEPVTFTLGKGQLIAGLEDLLVGSQVGQRVRALIPPEAGYLNDKLQPQPPSYGPRRELSSHANQNLFFEIEVRKVVSN